MLVLSRNVDRGETVRMRTPEGRTIVVHFLGWERGRLRVGFECDREVEVLRGELADRTEEQGKQPTE